MYTEKAKRQRRCTGSRKDGEPCKAFAAWDDASGRCNIHAGRHHKGTMYSTVTGELAPKRRSRAPNCTCRAYNWPHRPGGGYCRFPDEPLYRCPVRSGKHSSPRYRGVAQRIFYAARGGIEPGNWRRN
jgi:hypothetical protein